jgi:uncharacterized protein YfaP (DUF2135 family)
MKTNRLVFGKAFSLTVLCVLLLVSVFGCTSNNDTSSTTSTTSTSVTTTLPTTTTSTTSTPSSTTTTPTTSTLTTTPNTPEQLTIFSVSTGDVFLKKAGATTWDTAKVGMTLKPGDTIRAADGAKAEITFFDGSIIELTQDTQILISELSSGTGSTTIRIKQELGGTLSRVQKLVDQQTTFEVETPAAVAAVRGSVMTVTVDEQGVTVVTNLEGDIRATAQGVEVKIPEGYQCTIIPGQAPGNPIPVGQPTTTTTTTTANTTTLTTTTTIPPQAYLGTINTGVLPDRSRVGIGQTITYTYYISNSTGFALRNIQITDDIPGEAVYLHGDANSNGRLDSSETWMYSASHVVSASDPSPLINTAYFSVWVGTTYQLSAFDTARVNIGPLTVIITSPADGANVNTRTIEVTGTVNDYAITAGTITINGNSHIIAVTDGAFNTSENINNGENTITVSVTDSEETTASDTVIITAEIVPMAIRVELTWDTNGTDVDAHLIRPGSNFEEHPGDCHYNNRNPDWGLGEVSVDNPSLDQDDTNGYGPENITLEQPYEEGIYQYKVHYFYDYELGPTTATVRIWINDIEVFEQSKLISNGDIWDCAYISWPAGLIVEPPAANAGSVPLSNITVNEIFESAVVIRGDFPENGFPDTGDLGQYRRLYSEY